MRGRAHSSQPSVISQPLVIIAPRHVRRPRDKNRFGMIRRTEDSTIITL